MNPTFTNVSGLDTLAQDISDVEWTHWADLVNIYGTDETGLRAGPVGQRGRPVRPAGVRRRRDLRRGVRGPQRHGRWLESDRRHGPEGFPFTTTSPTPANFDPWSRRNAIPVDGDVAPRRAGDLLAIERAHTSGMVFQGDIDMPIIDWRHYLEHELDMHNTHQSFAARQRMLDADGDAGNHVVWFTDARPRRLRPDADGVRGPRRVDGEHRREPDSERGGEPARASRGLVLRDRRLAAGRRRGRLGRHPRRWTGGRVHGGVPDLHHLADRGRRADQR
jgi:hypothetical protein